MAEAAKPIDPNVAQDLARLALDLSHDKKTRKAFAKIVREAKPDSPHAAAFADVEVEDKFEAFQRAQEEKEIKREQAVIVARMNEQRQRLLSGDEAGGRKYSEDDVKKIEALMEKKGLTDYEDAAVLYAATLPPENTKPSNEPLPQGATWEMPQFAEYAKDPNKAARNNAYAVIDEFRRKRA
jgi:hypothetical protein